VTGSDNSSTNIIGLVDHKNFFDLVSIMIEKAKAGAASLDMTNAEIIDSDEEYGVKTASV
jgi:alkyl sulfatase BDS1-like metallo-beta-lactamase superfamily hydrolase